MTARRPRRSRRAQAPAPSLPRPGSSSEPAQSRTDSRSRGPQVREHHITRDYTYVRKDMVWVTSVSAITIGLILAAWLFAPSW